MSALNLDSLINPPLSSPLIIICTKESGGEVRIDVSNTGKNIIIIKLIILHMKIGQNAESIHWLRKDDFFYKKEEVEQGWNGLFYKKWHGNVLKAQCWAEYIEVTGRAYSKGYKLGAFS